MTFSQSSPLLCGFAFLAVHSAPSLQERAPRGFEQVDQEIRIGVRVGLMRFDKEVFSVRPGSKVALTLINTDSMQHNLLILRPGKDVAQKVGLLAQQLGDAAADKHFVPDTPDVLFHTQAILPGQTDTIWFKAPEKLGAYPYVCTLPGHMFTMRGVMYVGDVPPAKKARRVLDDVHYRLHDGRWDKLPVFADLKPERVGQLKDGLFDLGALKKEDHFGVEFFGTLKLRRSGRYTFFLNSDDGARVIVNGKQVVEYDGLHGMAGPKEGAIDLAAGKAELVIEYFQGAGGLGLSVAFEGPGVVRTELATKPKPRGSKAIPLMVMHDPVISRVHLEGGTSRSIAVGLRHGMNFCFDAGGCDVRFGWAGAYIDVGPDRTGRGGQPCKILGHRFEVGAIGFPLRRADGEEAPAAFEGYRTGDEPEFLIDWGGREVRWSIGPGGHGIGLRYTFRIADCREPVQFHLGKDAKMTAPVGQIEAGVLTIPASAAGTFVVTVEPRSEDKQ